MIPQRQELSALIDAIRSFGQPLEPLRIGRLEAFSAPGLDAILAIAGHGKTQFAVQTQYLIDRCSELRLVLCAGAAGYLLKNTPPARLLDALREVAAGGAPMSPEVARRVLRLFREFQPPAQATYRLTPQQHELLKLLVDGHHKKTAAEALGISVNTVSFHLKHIYEKLQVHSKTEAVAKALRERII